MCVYVCGEIAFVSRKHTLTHSDKINLTVKVCLFQTCPDCFPLDCDEKGENTPKEMQQPSISRDSEFFLNIASPEPY
jgi:hypothetical protein